MSLPKTYRLQTRAPGGQKERTIVKGMILRSSESHGITDPLVLVRRNHHNGDPDEGFWWKDFWGTDRYAIVSCVWMKPDLFKCLPTGSLCGTMEPFLLQGGPTRSRGRGGEVGARGGRRPVAAGP